MAAASINDVTARETMWRRYGGDDWAAFDALPPGIRRRMHEHAYDAWAVNALMLWKSFRRKRACSVRGERALLNYLDQCEAMELAGYDAIHVKVHGSHLPHVAARGTVLRYANTCPLIRYRRGCRTADGSKLTGRAMRPALCSPGFSTISR